MPGMLHKNFYDTEKRSMTDWADAKSELNELIARLRRVHEDLPSFYSDSLKGWDLSSAHTACMHLRSAIAELELLADKR
jgi:hypothetical protein